MEKQELVKLLGLMFDGVVKEAEENVFDDLEFTVQDGLELVVVNDCVISKKKPGYIISNMSKDMMIGFFKGRVLTFDELRSVCK